MSISAFSIRSANTFLQISGKAVRAQDRPRILPFHKFIQQLGAEPRLLLLLRHTCSFPFRESVWLTNT